MKIRKSAEDYLETMLILKEKHGYIRSVDIAEHLNVTKPSVSYAVKNLRENGYIEMDRSGFITLNESGMKIASEIYNRHKILTNLFTMMGVDPDTAMSDACKVEHCISDETFKAICDYMENK